MQSTLPRALVAGEAVVTLDTFQKFVCPVDKQLLNLVGDHLACSACAREFPLVNGIPILLNEENSVFRIGDYVHRDGYVGASGYGGSLDRSSGLKKAYRRFARKLSEAPVLGDHFNALEYISKKKPDAKLMVIGAGERSYAGDVTYTDVALAKNISCVCDAHDLPFPDDSFDAVIADAVLEHVCDPQRCVSEIHRVLRPNGFVVATTPFLQPVHMGAHDFTRFTYLGHRRLFRGFDEIASGQCGGPIYSAIHLFRDLLLCMTDNLRAQPFLRLLGLLITYPVRYLDYFFSRSLRSYNSACAFYFFGQKRLSPIPDREIISMFRGR